MGCLCPLVDLRQLFGDATAALRSYGESWDACVY
jgi:hypothetical protein